MFPVSLHGLYVSSTDGRGVKIRGELLNKGDLWQLSMFSRSIRDVADETFGLGLFALHRSRGSSHLIEQDGCRQTFILASFHLVVTDACTRLLGVPVCNTAAIFFSIFPQASHILLHHTRRIWTGERRKREDLFYGSIAFDGKAYCSFCMKLP